MDGSDDMSFPSLSATIQGRLTAETPQYSRRRCIYRVPNLLRETNEQSYTPLIVSIGPLHHKDEKLVPMESHKLKCLQSFLGVGDPHANANLLNSCLNIVKRWETAIRECYADPINLSSDDFTQMVLIDSVFIIQLFWILCNPHGREDDYIFDSPFLYRSVFRDLNLEENQLPLFILDELYCAKFPTGASSSFMEIVCKAFIIKLHCVNANVDENCQYYHLLHLMACNTGQPAGSTNTTNIPDENDAKPLATTELIFPPATQLHEAGVKFQLIKDSSSLLHIEFDNLKGILKIPELQVSDGTEYRQRNLIAFEQCHYGYNDTRYFTDYHIFLNWLINTPEDVQLLTKAGIIKNLMGSPQQVSDLINSLDIYAYSSYERFYYEKISVQLQSHCNKRWNRYRATLMHTYFNHPWAAISVAYAFVLLLLTILQVVSGIMAIPK